MGSRFAWAKCDDVGQCQSEGCCFPLFSGIALYYVIGKWSPPIVFPFGSRVDSSGQTLLMRSFYRLF